MTRRAVRPYTLGVRVAAARRYGWRLAVRAFCPCVPLQQVTGACLLTAAAPFHRNQEMSRRLLGCDQRKSTEKTFPLATGHSAVASVEVEVEPPVTGCRVGTETPLA